MICSPTTLGRKHAEELDEADDRDSLKFPEL